MDDTIMHGGPVITHLITRSCDTLERVSCAGGAPHLLIVHAFRWFDATGRTAERLWF